jgi:fructokinase
LVDFLGEDGTSLVDATRFRPAPGGAPANVAVAVARAGAPVAFVGRVGRDAFGQRLRGVLEEAGVDCGQLLVDPEAHTTLAFVVPAARGAHGFEFVRGADARLAPEDLPAPLLQGRSALGCGGVSLSGEPARSATLHALRAARAAGVLAVFDVNWRPALWPSPQEAVAAFREAIALADVIRCNEAELDLLLGREGASPEQARALLGSATAVVLTRGHRGAAWVDTRRVLTHPGFPVDAVDAIGAGDCFTGTLLAWWDGRPAAAPGALADKDVATLLCRCNAAAALSTLHPGAMAAMPPRARVDRFLRERGAG